jgi:hypothetical protein
MVGVESSSEWSLASSVSQMRGSMTGSDSVIDEGLGDIVELGERESTLLN